MILFLRGAFKSQVTITITTRNVRYVDGVTFLSLCRMCTRSRPMLIGSCISFLVSNDGYIVTSKYCFPVVDAVERRLISGHPVTIIMTMRATDAAAAAATAEAESR